MKQKADGRFRKAEQAAPPKGRKKRKKTKGEKIQYLPPEDTGTRGRFGQLQRKANMKAR